MADNFSKKVAIWGTPPPPIGGMTVHIERLIQRLAQENINFEIYNFTGKPHPNTDTTVVKSLPKWYLNLLLGSSADIHYVISTRPQVRFLAVLFACFRRKKVILRVGGKSLEEALQGPALQSWMTRFALRNTSAFIGVNPQICALANRYRKNEDAHYIPGFISPMDTGLLPPKEVQEFWREGYPKILVSGQILAKNEFDIYGVWDTLAAVEKLRAYYPQLRLVIFSYLVVNKNKSDIESYKTEIKQRGLEEHILIFESQTILWPSIKHCDLFLRPSHTDGDANSLREALTFGKPSVASDAVSRPEGSMLYPTENIEEMVKTIRQGIENSMSTPETKSDNARKIINLIRSL